MEYYLEERKTGLANPESEARKVLGERVAADTRFDDMACQSNPRKGLDGLARTFRRRQPLDRLMVDIMEILE